MQLSQQVYQKVDGLSSDFSENRNQIDDITADLDTVKIVTRRTHDLFCDQVAASAEEK